MLGSPVQPIILGDRTPPRYYTEQDRLGSWLIVERTPRGPNILGAMFTEAAARAAVTAFNQQHARARGAVVILGNAPLN